MVFLFIVESVSIGANLNNNANLGAREAIHVFTSTCVNTEVLHVLYTSAFVLCSSSSCLFVTCSLQLAALISFRQDRARNVTQCGSCGNLLKCSDRLNINDCFLRHQIGSKTNCEGSDIGIQICTFYFLNSAASKRVMQMI